MVSRQSGLGRGLGAILPDALDQPVPQAPDAPDAPESQPRDPETRPMGTLSEVISAHLAVTDSGISLVYKTLDELDRVSGARASRFAWGRPIESMAGSWSTPAWRNGGCCI